jgi:hypothetical protein
VRKQAYGEQGWFLYQVRSIIDQSAGNDVLCLRAFLALGHSKFNLLTFAQSFETSVLNRAVMNKYVRSIGLFDEAEAFGFIEKLNLTFNCCHDIYILQKIKILR